MGKFTRTVIVAVFCLLLSAFLVGQLPGFPKNPLFILIDAALSPAARPITIVIVLFVAFGVGMDQMTEGDPL